MVPLVLRPVKRVPQVPLVLRPVKRVPQVQRVPLALQQVLQGILGLLGWVLPVLRVPLDPQDPQEPLTALLVQQERPVTLESQALKALQGFPACPESQGQLTAVQGPQVRLESLVKLEPLEPQVKRVLAEPVEPVELAPPEQQDLLV